MWLFLFWNEGWHTGSLSTTLLSAGRDFDEFWMWLPFVLPILVPLEVTVYGLELWFTCSPCISSVTQLCVSPHLSLQSQLGTVGCLWHRGDWEWWIMQQADCSWKHPTKPRLSQEFCWNMRNSGAVQEPTKGGKGGGCEGGAKGETEGRRGRGKGFYWDSSAPGEGNVLWSKARNVKAVMWVNGSYFGGPDGNVGDERWH